LLRSSSHRPRAHPARRISLDVLPSQAVTPSPDAVVHGNSTERSRHCNSKRLSSRSVTTSYWGQSRR
jgi:hypothetical protein